MRGVGALLEQAKRAVPEAPRSSVESVRAVRSATRLARPPDAPRNADGSTLGGVAVVIATNLRKEISGDPLFDGVSFKVERRDRVSLSGPNGAGKTTLLRILSG